MVHLNYNNLDATTQENLLSVSKKEIEQNIGEDLKTYAIKNNYDYETLLEEEAIRNLYNYKFLFSI